MQDQESTRGSLLQWCYTSYGEVFIPLFIFSLTMRCILCNGIHLDVPLAGQAGQPDASIMRLLNIFTVYHNKS